MKIDPTLVKLSEKEPEKLYEIIVICKDSSIVPLDELKHMGLGIISGPSIDLGIVSGTIKGKQIKTLAELESVEFIEFSSEQSIF